MLKSVFLTVYLLPGNCLFKIDLFWPFSDFFKVFPGLFSETARTKRLSGTTVNTIGFVILTGELRGGYLIPTPSSFLKLGYSKARYYIFLLVSFRLNNKWYECEPFSALTLDPIEVRITRFYQNHERRISETKHTLVDSHTSGTSALNEVEGYWYNTGLVTLALNPILGHPKNTHFKQNFTWCGISPGGDSVGTWFCTTKKLVVGMECLGPMGVSKPFTNQGSRLKWVSINLWGT